MAAYCRVHDSRHLQADCQEPGSAPEPYARQLCIGYLYLLMYISIHAHSVYTLKSVAMLSQNNCGCIDFEFAACSTWTYTKHSDQKNKGASHLQINKSHSSVFMISIENNN